MLSGPVKRSPIAGLWPEITAVAVCVFLLGPLQVPVVAGVLLALGAYAAFYAIARVSQRGESASADPPIEQIVAELSRYQGSLGNSALWDDLSELTRVIGEGLLSTPARDQDPALRELTRETASQVLGYTQQIAALPRPPQEGSPLYAQFSNLLRESTEELRKSYAAVDAQDSAALAEQIKGSTQNLQELHQQLRKLE